MGHWHHVPTCNYPQFLTFYTPFTEAVSVLKHSRLIKSTLQNFFSSFLNKKMATISFCMAEFYDTKGFIIWDTSPQDLIRAVFKQIRIIPIEISYLNKEFAPIIVQVLEMEHVTR